MIQITEHNVKQGDYGIIPALFCEPARLVSGANTLEGVAKRSERRSGKADIHKKPRKSAVYAW
tara:strand:- start:326 stop:514 length:189 start_codon:yes stop_codon:yes gene_type:complete